MQTARPIKAGESYNNLSIDKVLKLLEKDFGKIEREVLEVWQRIRAISSEVILEKIESNLKEVLNKDKSILYLAEPNKRIWIEADIDLVKREYLDDVKRLLPPILAYFKEDMVIAYVPGTDLKIHEVLIWDINKKAKFACSCDNYRLIGNIRTIGTCAHVRTVLYWLSGSLKKFYDAKYDSLNGKDINFILKKEEDLRKLLELVKKSINERKLEKIEGGAIWRLGMANIFVGIIMSYPEVKSFLKGIYEFRGLIKQGKDYFRELEKELSANLFKSKNIQWR